MDATHDSYALLVAVASGFLLFAGGFWIIVSLGNWALAPVERRPVAARLPTQFSLREFALVVIEMQFVAAAIFWWCGDSAMAHCGIGAASCALLLAWWHGAQRLARCGITCPWRRGVFLTVVTPLATAGITAALWINGHAVLQTCLGRHWPLSPWLAGNLVITGAFVTCRLLTMWAMHNVTPRRATEAHEEGIQYVS